jgi:acetyl esterase/lipase
LRESGDHELRRDFLKKATGLAFMAAPVLDLIRMRQAAAAEGLDDEESGNGLNGPMEAGPFEIPSGARVERELPYGDSPRQRLDVYLPDGATKAPLIFMVHGGGWSKGDKRQWRVVKNKATHWLGKGYIFVSANYQMLPFADPLTQAEDIARALAFVQSRLDSWGGDSSRVIVMGHSAGAHLVSLLTVSTDLAARHGVRPWLATISLDSAAMDVEQIMQGRHFRLYDDAFKNDPSYWRRASPMEQLKGKPMAPILVVCSSRRGDSCPQGHAFAAKASRFGGHVDVLPVDLSHAEVNDFLGAKNSYTDSVDAFLEKQGLD